MSSVAPGTVLAGKYRVTRVLGEGGMGVVVAAVHVQLDEPVALKFMLPSALGSTEAIARFLREARSAVKLKSEHVARVSDVGTLDTGAPYIVMEYLEGSDLAGELLTRGPLPPTDTVEYVVQACDALAEAHALGIVHRDLKPANLFVTRRRDGSPLVKVLDFGISKSSALNEVGGGGSLTKTGGLMGSPVYMSPEQMKSAKDVDARTDIWSLGIILYELVGGRRPFESETLGGIMSQVLTVTPPPLEQVRPGLPPVLYATIARCLEKERERRWSSVADLVTALAPIAPPRAQPLIERIAGASLGRTVLDVSGAGRVPAAGNVASARTGPPSKTAPGWAETGGGGKAKSGNKGLIAAAVSAIVLVAITAVAVPMVRRGAHGPDGGSAATTAAAGSANESISALPAVQPPPEPMHTAAVEPPHPPATEPAPSVSANEPPVQAKAPPVGSAPVVHKKGLTATPAATTHPTTAKPAKPAADLLDTSN